MNVERRSLWRRAAVLVAVLAAPLALATAPSDQTSAAWTDTSYSATNAQTLNWLATSPTALALSNSSARLSWQPADGHATYTIQRATNASFTAGLTSYTANGTSYDFSDLNASTTYYYRVRGAANTSLPWSATAAARTGPGNTSAGTLIAKTGSPHGLAVDSLNRIWYVDYVEGSVKRVASDGTGPTVITNAFAPRTMRGISYWYDNGVYVAGNGAPTGTGIYSVTGSGAVTQQNALAGAYGVGRDSRQGTAWATGANSDGTPNMAIYRCHSGWRCDRLYDGIDSLGYIHLSPTGTQAIVGGNTRIRLVDTTYFNTEVALSIDSADIRSVHAIADNDFLLASFTRGIIWRVTVNPATDATSSQIVATGATGALGMGRLTDGTLTLARSTGSAATSGIYRMPFKVQ